MSEDYKRRMRLVRLGIDTQQELIVYIPNDCLICKSEGFETQTQVIVSVNGYSIVATLNVIYSEILKAGEISLSESAWKKMNLKEGDLVSLSHLHPIKSLEYVRAKIYGHALNQDQFNAIFNDIVAGNFANLQIASFVTACAHDNLSIDELAYMTRAMIDSGSKIYWDSPIVVDKHSVGGLPGNRTTPIVVAIIAAAGLIIPKTSSRAITSPAGTADTVETMTKVALSIEDIQRVVKKEGGCMVWGGALGLSPADDLIIKVERVLDIDPEMQMIASVLSKKAAAGATHVIIDIPVGPTAKIRSDEVFTRLDNLFRSVGKALGMNVLVIKSDGFEPLGKGIGPALEARDILAVLRQEQEAPLDLKNKALDLAGQLIDFSGAIVGENGLALATRLLETGMAYKKFLAICEAQGGFWEPQTASLTHDILAEEEGIITEIDNRNLAKIAKLAGAPHDPAAGIEFFAKIGRSISKGDLLYRIHAETQGELDYALAYVRAIDSVVKVRKG